MGLDIFYSSRLKVKGHRLQAVRLVRIVGVIEFWAWVMTGV